MTHGLFHQTRILVAVNPAYPWFMKYDYSAYPTQDRVDNLLKAHIWYRQSVTKED
jgi:hypothetical protein